MTDRLTDKYRGHRWIPVKRTAAVEIAGARYVLEEHHVEETEFLIEEIRKLARQIDAMNG